MTGPAETSRDAREVLQALVGTEIRTLTGRRNHVLALERDVVVVGTDRSPNGKPVPIKDVQAALDALRADGAVSIDVESVGYRSGFVGAVLLTLPGTERVEGTRVVRLRGSLNESRRDGT